MTPQSFDDTIHSDGTVETILKWRPGGARGNVNQILINDEDYLMAVPLANDRWDVSVVRFVCDGDDGPTSFECQDMPWEWDWLDVEWFLPVRELDLPMP